MLYHTQVHRLPHLLTLLAACLPGPLPAVCASGWYGVTSYATKQASCNQCPGTRPVSPEGARSSSDCKACPEGHRPNEIYSECGECSPFGGTLFAAYCG